MAPVFSILNFIGVKRKNSNLNNLLLITNNAFEYLFEKKKVVLLNGTTQLKFILGLYTKWNNSFKKLFKKLIRWANFSTHLKCKSNFSMSIFIVRISVVSRLNLNRFRSIGISKY